MHADGDRCTLFHSIPSKQLLCNRDVRTIFSASSLSDSVLCLCFELVEAINVEYSSALF